MLFQDDAQQKPRKVFRRFLSISTNDEPLMPLIKKKTLKKKVTFLACCSPLAVDMIKKKCILKFVGTSGEGEKKTYWKTKCKGPTTSLGDFQNPCFLGGNSEKKKSITL